MISTPTLLIALIFLLVLSAFFSAAETSMMAINRYRLRHQVRKKNKLAIIVAKLLERPDQLLAVILIGNTFANIAASALATMIAANLYGELGVAIAAVLLTIIVLLLSEVSPKTLAAIYPQKIAFATAWPLRLFLILLYPIVFCVNLFTNGLLKLFNSSAKALQIEHLTSEELSTLLAEAGGKIPASYQAMLQSILQLEKISVEDVMIPRQQIVGIDISQSWENIIKQIYSNEHARLPVYEEHINQLKGVVHMRKVLPLLAKQTFNLNDLLRTMDEPLFLPESATLHQQLKNFLAHKIRMGFVVDEYGEILGLITLEDILEEIVGDFTTNISDKTVTFIKQSDSSVLLDAGMNIREINRRLKIHLPARGPKTLNGLIIEYLEMMPTEPLCLRIGDYRIEIVEIDDNRITKVKILI